MKPLVLGILVVCAPAWVFAQALPPPPLVEAPREPTRAPQPAPGPEVGLMVTQSLYGMLTAAGSGLLFYYLVAKPLDASARVSRDPSQTQLANLIFLLGFASVPLAVAQTQVGLANESRNYVSEAWPAALSGLAAQAAVIGLYSLVREQNAGHGEAVLLIGTVVGVPLVEMAVINLTKKPRGGPRLGAALMLGEEGLEPGIPLATPTLLPGGDAPRLGLSLPVLQGRF